MRHPSLPHCGIRAFPELRRLAIVATGRYGEGLSAIHLSPMFEGLRFNHWKTSLDDSGIVTLTLDRANSSVNAISREVLDELGQIVERLAIEKPAGVLIHSAKPNRLRRRRRHQGVRRVRQARHRAGKHRERPARL